MNVAAFSFASWKSGRGITSAGLTENQRTELMEDLGLSQFVNQDSKKCSSTTAPFAGAVNNWKNGGRVIHVIRLTSNKLKYFPAQFIFLFISQSVL